MFKDFCFSIKNEELYKKKKYENNAKRNKNLSDLRRDIEYQMKKKKTDYWCKVFEKNKIPNSKINNVKDVIKNKDARGIKYLWMQLTVRNDYAAELAEEAGLEVIMDRCPKIEFGRLSGELSWLGVNSGIITSKTLKSPKHD